MTEFVMFVLAYYSDESLLESGFIYLNTDSKHRLAFLNPLRGIVYPQMTIISSNTHAHIVQNPF